MSSICFIKSTLNIITIFFLLLSMSCSKKDIKAERNKLFETKEDIKIENLVSSWDIQGSAANKIIKVSSDTIVALTESYPAKWNTQRSVYILKKDVEAKLLDLGESKSEEFITDIGEGSEKNSFFVSMLSINKEKHEFVVKILFLKEDSGHFKLVKHNTFVNSPSVLLNKDSKEEEFLTMDLARIAVKGKHLNLVARDYSGTLYLQEFTIIDSEGTLKSEALTPLALPSTLAPILLTGGSTDVMSELSQVYKVMSLFSSDGTFYAVSTVYTEDLENNKKNGLKHFNSIQLPNCSKFLGYMAVVYKLKDNQLEARATCLEDDNRPFNHTDNIVQSASIAPNGALYLAGLKRNFEHEGDDRGESEVFIIDEKGKLNTFKSKHASMSAQALIFDEKNMLVGGSWKWSQNPGGGSIVGGKRYFSSIDLKETKDWSPINLIQNGGRRRSEVRTAFYRDHIICLGGMENGPDTHAADNNTVLLKTDGFVSCFLHDSKHQ